MKKKTSKIKLCTYCCLPSGSREAYRAGLQVPVEIQMVNKETYREDLFLGSPFVSCIMLLIIFTIFSIYSLKSI